MRWLWVLVFCAGCFRFSVPPLPPEPGMDNEARTRINAIYKCLPPKQRTCVETTVKGK